MRPRRGKITVARIVDDNKRKASLKKRRNGLLKKAEELSVLCKAETAVVVYTPGKKEPEMWPTEAEIETTFQRYINLSEAERQAHTETAISFCDKKIKKMETKLFMLKYKNEENIVQRILKRLDDEEVRIDELSAEEKKMVVDYSKKKIQELARFHQKKKKEIEGGASSSAAAPPPPPPPSSNPSELFLPSESAGLISGENWVVPPPRQEMNLSGGTVRNFAPSLGFGGGMNEVVSISPSSSGVYVPPPPLRPLAVPAIRSGEMRYFSGGTSQVPSAQSGLSTTSFFPLQPQQDQAPFQSRVDGGLWSFTHPDQPQQQPHQVEYNMSYMPPDMQTQAWLPVTHHPQELEPGSPELPPLPPQLEPMSIKLPSMPTHQAPVSPQLPPLPPQLEPLSFDQLEPMFVDLLHLPTDQLEPTSPQLAPLPPQLDPMFFELPTLPTHDQQEPVSPQLPPMPPQLESMSFQLHPPGMNAQTLEGFEPPGAANLTNVLDDPCFDDLLQDQELYEGLKEMFGPDD